MGRLWNSFTKRLLYISVFGLAWSGTLENPAEKWKETITMLLGLGWVSWTVMIVSGGLFLHTFVEGTKWDPLPHVKAYLKRVTRPITGAQSQTSWSTDYARAVGTTALIMLPVSFVLYVILRIDIPIVIEVVWWSVVVIYFYVRRLEKVGKTEEKREILAALSRFVSFFGGLFVMIVMFVLIGQVAIFIGRWFRDQVLLPLQ